MENWVYPHGFWQFEAEVDLSNLFFNFKGADFLKVQFLAWSVSLLSFKIFAEEVDFVPPLELWCLLVPSIVVSSHHYGYVFDVEVQLFVESFQLVCFEDSFLG